MPEPTEREVAETNRLPTAGPQPVYGFDDVGDTFEPIHSSGNALHVKVVSGGDSSTLPAGASTEATLLEVRNNTLATAAAQTTGNSSLGGIQTLLTGTGSLSRAVQTTANNTVTIAASDTVSSALDLSGRSLLRVIIPAGWTTADINVQISIDAGATFFDLYDEYGGLYVIKAGASRAIFIAPGPLIGVNFLKLKSTVAQTSSIALTLISQVL